MTCVLCFKGCISFNQKASNLSVAMMCSSVKGGKLKPTPTLREKGTRLTECAILLGDESIA